MSGEEGEERPCSSIGPSSSGSSKTPTSQSIQCWNKGGRTTILPNENHWAMDGLCLKRREERGLEPGDRTCIVRSTTSSYV